MFVSVPTEIGYAGVAAFVLAESAGVPVPGETALVAAGLLAGSGHLSLALVVLIAAVSAIIGDNIGFAVGRKGGRAALTASGPLAGHRQRALDAGEKFFAKHGAKTVFFGRWVTGVRIVAALVAGASGMRWPLFLTFNVLGAFAWAATIAGIAALAGPVAVGIVYGAGVAIALVAVGIPALARLRARRQRVAS